MNDKAVEVANNAVAHMPRIVHQTNEISELLGQVQLLRSAVSHLRRDWNVNKLLPDATLREIEDKLLSLVMVLSAKEDILRLELQTKLDMDDTKDIPF